MKLEMKIPFGKKSLLNLCNDFYDEKIVKINYNEINNFNKDKIKIQSEDETMEMLPNSNFSEACKFAIAMNSINYMFWDKDKDNNFIRYEKNGVVGAMAMTEAFKEHWNNIDSPLYNARKGVPLELEDIYYIFGDIPDPESRMNILNDIFADNKLNEWGEFFSTFENGDKINTSLAKKLSEDFSLAYSDIFLKKSQLALSFIYREAKARNVKLETEFTAFADYQIPNVLRSIGILEYSNELTKKIDNYELIEENSPEELAIRAASVLAIEKMAENFNLEVADIDLWIWTQRKKAVKPFHLTKTVNY